MSIVELLSEHFGAEFFAAETPQHTCN